MTEGKEELNAIIKELQAKSEKIVSHAKEKIEHMVTKKLKKAKKKKIFTAEREAQLQEAATKIKEYHDRRVENLRKAMENFISDLDRRGGTAPETTTTTTKTP